MKNVICLLLCTCLLVVDAGIISNRDSEESVVQAETGEGMSPQVSYAAQPQSEKSIDPEKSPDDLTPENVDADNESEDALSRERENLHSEEVPAYEASDDANMESESQENEEPSVEVPVFEDVLESLKQFFNPLLSPTFGISNSYPFNSQPQTELYRSIIEDIRYRMEAIVRRQDLIVKFIKCSCPNARKCRKLHLNKYKPLSLHWHDLIHKQFQIPGFGSSNFQLPGASYTDYVLTALTMLKSAVEKVTLRQSVLYKYTLCSCSKNECSDKIKPALDALFSIDDNLLSTLATHGGSSLSQLGSGLGSLSQNLFGSSGEDLLTFNKPNITTFGNGSTSGAVYSGTIGESSNPSGGYVGSYVSSSSNDRQPSSGASSGVQTSCVGNAPCETSGGVSLQIGENKPEEIHLSFSKPQGSNGTSNKPLSSLIQAIAELGNVASNITTSLGESTPESAATTSGLVSTLTETSQLANELLNKLTSNLNGSGNAQSLKPRTSSSDSTEVRL